MSEKNELSYNFHIVSVTCNDKGLIDSKYRIKISWQSSPNSIMTQPLEGLFFEQEKEALERLSKKFPEGDGQWFLKSLPKGEQ